MTLWVLGARGLPGVSGWLVDVGEGRCVGRVEVLILGADVGAEDIVWVVFVVFYVQLGY
jgi:hypothetical protein